MPETPIATETAKEGVAAGLRHIGALAVNNNLLHEVLAYEHIDLSKMTKYGVDFQGIYFSDTAVLGSNESSHPSRFFGDTYGVFNIEPNMPSNKLQLAAVILNTPKIVAASEDGFSVLHNMKCKSVDVQSNLSAELIRQFQYVGAFLEQGSNNPISGRQQRVNRMYRFMGRGRTLTAADKLELREEMAARKQREQRFAQKTAQLLAHHPELRRIVEIV